MHPEARRRERDEDLLVGLVPEGGPALGLRDANDREVDPLDADLLTEKRGDRRDAEVLRQFRTQHRDASLRLVLPVVEHAADIDLVVAYLEKVRRRPDHT